MPAFFLSTEQYIHGIVMANYTSGAPVRGNLTLKATVRPIRPIDPNRMIKKNMPRPMDVTNQYYDPNRASDYPYNNYPTNNSYGDQYQHQYGGYDKPIEKYFNFNEILPFWFSVPENYYEPVPVMKFVSSTLKQNK